jgi:hypothetical protein
LDQFEIDFIEMYWKAKELECLLNFVIHQNFSLPKHSLAIQVASSLTSEVTVHV